MAQTTNKLTDTAARQAKPDSKPYKLADGGGLFLLVQPNGAKYWRMGYRFGSKEKLLALGVYPEITLKAAREKRDAARKLIANGADPSEAKRAEKLAQSIGAANSFAAVAREWYEKEKPHWSDSHATRTLRALEKDLFPRLGNRPIADIKAPELLAELRKVEGRGAVETAHRVKQVAGQVFRYAVATGRAERDPSGDLKGALAMPKETHHAAITDPTQVGALLVTIDEYSGTPTVRAALQLSPLFFVRPGVLRSMEWTEINWGENRWEIPASKMKTGQPHIVPLCRQALEILQDIQPLTGRGRYVFPSARGGSRPLSENGVRSALRSLGYSNDEMTPHGFRAMARTIMDEVLGIRVDLIEHQLAHAVRDPNGRAYNRTTHLDGRREMMQKWADYLDDLREKARPAKKMAEESPRTNNAQI